MDTPTSKTPVPNTEISRKDFFLAHAIQGLLASGMRDSAELVQKAITVAEIALKRS